MSTFQGNLRHYREKAGYRTVKAFVKDLGIPYTTYLSYEKGIKEPSGSNIIKIADKLGITTDELLGRTPTVMNKKIIFPAVDAKGKPLKKQPENIRAVLDCMGLAIRYNISSKEVEIVDHENDRTITSSKQYSFLGSLADINSICEINGLDLSIKQLNELVDGLARRTIVPGTKNRTSEEIILLDRLGWDSDTDKWTWRLLSDLCIMLDIPNNRIRLLGRAISRLMLEDNRIKKNTNHHSNATYLLPPVRGADENSTLSVIDSAEVNKESVKCKVTRRTKKSFSYPALDTDKIKLLMIKSQLNYRDLAKLSDITESTLRGVLDYEKKPHTSTMGKIAKGLQVDLTEIIKEWEE